MLPADYTFVAGDDGVHVALRARSTPWARRPSTATDTVTARSPARALGITVDPGCGHDSGSVGHPGPRSPPATAGSVTVTAKDAFGNTATGYTGTVHFTSTDAAACLPANYTFVGGDNGVHTFTNAYTLKTAGTQTLTATDTVTGTITGTSSSDHRQPGRRHHSAFCRAPRPRSLPAPARTSRSRRRTPTATSPPATPAPFTSPRRDAAAVLPANYTFVGGDNGVHTFTNAYTLKTAGTQTVTATDTVHRLDHRHQRRRSPSTRPPPRR